MWIIGHRGAAGHEPENTLRAIRRAIAFGVDGVEIDVRAVGGELVVFHDDVLERTTDGHGALSAIGFADLRRLDAGCGERVPLLDEVLALIDARIVLNIELKERGLAAPVLEVTARHRARQPAWRDRLVYSSFDVDETATLARLGAERLGVLFTGDEHGARERARRLRAWSLHPSLAQLDAGLVTAAHAAGIKVLVYTVNDAAALARCTALGVDGVFSDYPDRALAARAAMHDPRPA